MRSRPLALAVIGIVTLTITLGTSRSVGAQRPHYEIFAGTVMPTDRDKLGDGFEGGAAIVRPVGVSPADVGLTASWTTLAATDNHSLNLLSGGVLGRYHLTLTTWQPYVTGSVGLAVPTAVGDARHGTSTSSVVFVSRGSRFRHRSVARGTRCNRSRLLRASPLHVRGIDR